jgi:DNA-binding NarL/FixJ family response regulator
MVNWKPCEVAGLMNPSKLVLIVAAPGNLQAGLQILLAKLPEVETLVVADRRSALGTIARQKPALVIVDCDASKRHCPELLRQIRGGSPDLRCLALLNQVGELAEATEAGADVALIKGFPAKKLLATVKRLLAAGEMHQFQSSKLV